MGIRLTFRTNPSYSLPGVQKQLPVGQSSAIIILLRLSARSAEHGI